MIWLWLKNQWLVFVEPSVLLYIWKWMVPMISENNPQIGWCSQFIPMKSAFCVPVCYMDSYECFLISQKSFGLYHQVCLSPYWMFGRFNVWIGRCFGFHDIDRGASRELPNTVFFQCIINYSLLITWKELMVQFHVNYNSFFQAIKNVITCDVSVAMWFFSHPTVHHKTDY